MNYSIIVNGKNYTLPKKTISVMEKLDDALKVDTIKNLSVRQKYEKLHTFVRETVGADNAAEMFESNDISEIDTSELALTVLKIEAAYNEPINTFKQSQTIQKLDAVPMEKISALVKGAQTVANAQMLSRC